MGAKVEKALYDETVKSLSAERSAHRETLARAAAEHAEVLVYRRREQAAQGVVSAAGVEVLERIAGVGATLEDAGGVLAGVGEALAGAEQALAEMRAKAREVHDATSRRIETLRSDLRVTDDDLSRALMETRGQLAARDLACLEAAGALGKATNRISGLEIDLRTATTRLRLAERREAVMVRVLTRSLPEGWEGRTAWDLMTDGMPRQTVGVLVDVLKMSRHARALLTVLNDLLTVATEAGQRGVTVADGGGEDVAPEPAPAAAPEPAAPLSEVLRDPIPADEAPAAVEAEPVADVVEPVEDPAPAAGPVSPCPGCEYSLETDPSGHRCAHPTDPAAPGMFVTSCPVREPRRPAAQPVQAEAVA